MRLANVPPMLRYVRRVTLVILGAIAFTSACGDGPLREDEFLCQEAYAQLEKCCRYDQLSQASYYCAFDDRHAPALTPDESRCVLAESCSTLQTTGVCKRLPGADPQRDVARPQGVCP